MLCGGFLPGSIILVRGAPGTGKTSLAFQFLLEGATHGEAGVFISFEEFPLSLYRDAESLGLNLRDMESQGKLRIIFTSPDVLLNGLQDPDNIIQRTLVEQNIRRAVVDSATHFARITEDPTELRNMYNHVVNGLRRESITTLLLSEERRSEYQRADKGGLAFLSDGIIILRYVEVESAVERAIVVLKLRGSDHTREIRHYTIQQGGLQVGGIFEERGAILSGISQRY